MNTFENPVRVLSFSEIPDFPGPVWLEDKDKSDVIPALFKHVLVREYDNILMIVFSVRKGEEVEGFYRDYNIRWRAWSEEPRAAHRYVCRWGNDENN